MVDGLARVLFLPVTDPIAPRHLVAAAAEDRPRLDVSLLALCHLVRSMEGSPDSGCWRSRAESNRDLRLNRPMHAPSCYGCVWDGPGSNGHLRFWRPTGYRLPTPPQATGASRTRVSGTTTPRPSVRRPWHSAALNRTRISGSRARRLSVRRRHYGP